MRCEVRPESFAPWEELRHYEEQRAAAPGAVGAIATFVGTMRDFNEGETVHGMELEHYPGMTEKYLAAICTQAQARWPLLDVLILHRVGSIVPGEAIVLVAVWSAHRAAAFDACRYLMEELKSRAPFWKKERLAGGARWVEHNTPGR